MTRLFVDSLQDKSQANQRRVAYEIAQLMKRAPEMPEEYTTFYMNFVSQRLETPSRTDSLQYVM